MAGWSAQKKVESVVKTSVVLTTGGSQPTIRLFEYETEDKIV